MGLIKTSFKTTANQFWRYVTVGLLNTAIDFAVLNLLSAATGITKGNGLIPINIISFSVAIINSYFFNKYWSFDDKSFGDHGKKFSKFMLVSIIGALANTLIVRFITTDIHPFLSLTPRLWLNAAKIIATCFTFAWNFSGYKIIVFKK
ncbi:MAG TPA: GtrA family protein [Methylomirabilota bacterium]|nr:GtrA family protein [Methylomirabilota bacterium]